MNDEIKASVLKEIETADMLLVGLGEEFDQKSQLLNNSEYRKREMKLKEQKQDWLIPTLMEYYRSELNLSLSNALDQLQKILEKKNYYIISTSLSEEIRERNWLRNHLTMPLGSIYRCQCSEQCSSVPYRMSEEEKQLLPFLVMNEVNSEDCLQQTLGTCPICGKPKRSNTVYLLDEYDERGYQDEWKRYTNWLQLTLNKKVFLLELGVGLDYPGVIRWPFEKIASLNQKSRLCRIHSQLYQLPEGLAQKGISVHENAIAWLERL